MTSTLPPRRPAELLPRLADVSLLDAATLRRRIQRLRPGDDRDLSAVLEQLTRAESRHQQRLRARPQITFPPELPVSARRADIAAAIRDNQVVVVAGETGSGKTTQLPKICLELGRGVRGTIGHTQPRRLAARTVAERIAAELGTELGDAVGYVVRFNDRVGDSTLVKVMTDGILLAEIRRDRDLLRYDTIIIDEAHERSLTIDFLLGYLKQLLPRRPDLKLIITSATIDPGRFSRHFDDAPVVEVSGRTYPVEIRYRPLEVVLDDDDLDEPTERREPRDQTEGIVAAVRELSSEGPGDVLVFLSGEREIRDTTEALRAENLRDTEILPLYARLAVAEQHKVFTPHSRRHVVLATNVAETSLTVPGVHYVVDPGTARISRYSHRTKVQRLPVEAISQASASQRSGRCGRTADGITIRLYSQADFDGRPEYTEPEILRTNLAAVLLQMTALGLGELEAFPFLDPPDRRSIRDAVVLLHELGALDSPKPDAPRRLTDVGRTMARLPVDPRWARMIVEADRQGCVREVLVIAAALSISDPRERPAEERAQADRLHARFADEHSDFAAWLNLYTFLRDQQQELSGNAFRRLCRSEYLHYLRVREWQDLVGQLRAAARSVGIETTDQPADAGRVLTAVTAGLLSHVGAKQGDRREYLGARGARFVIAPGTPLASKSPRWVVAGELVETSRLYARTVARVDPVDVEKLAGHLVERSYSEPHWNADRGGTSAYERVTLYGLPLIPKRRVDYGRIDPPVARDLFIRHALVGGEWKTHHTFWAANERVRAEVAELEDRLRRRDLAVDDETLVSFYDARLPADIVSVRHFDRWFKRADKHTLDLTRDDLIDVPADDADRPREWLEGDVSLPLTYRFDPGAIDDGVTVHVPAEFVATLDPDTFAWQVPALREELVTALVRGLPKDVRRALGPAPNVVRAVLAQLTPGREPLVDALTRVIRQTSGVLVPRDAWNFEALPKHLRVTVAVERDGREVARGEDLARLQETVARPVRDTVGAEVARSLDRDGLTSFDVERLPRVVRERRAGQTVDVFPALVDAGSTVNVRVYSTEAEQAVVMRAATRRLLRLTAPQLAAAGRQARSQQDSAARLLFAANPDGNLDALIDDALDCAIDAIVGRHGGPAWDQSGFGRLQLAVGAELSSTTDLVMRRARTVLAAAQQARAALPGVVPPAQREAVADLNRQFDALLPARFLTVATADRLADLARYLTAATRRIEALARDPALDLVRMGRVLAVEAEFNRVAAALAPARRLGPDVLAVRWQIEEFRVSLFAQALGTPRPVSEARIQRALDAIVGS